MADAPSMTNRRGLMCSVAANWVGFAAQITAAFFISPVLVHGLGDRRYGIWSLVESVLAYLMLFDLGVAASVVRYVARFEATRDQDALNRVFNASFCIFAAAGTAILGITLAVAFPAFGLLHVPEDLAAEGRWMLVLLGLNLAVGLPMSVFNCLLDGLGRYPAKSAIRTTCILLRSGVFLLVIRSGGSLLAVALTVTACSMVEHVAMALAARHYLPGLRFSPRLVDRPTLRAIRSYSTDALLAMLAGRVSFQTDAIVINSFLLPQSITLFAVAARLVEYSKDSLRVATMVLTPAVSALEARGDSEGIRGVLINSTRYVLWLILPVQLGLILLGRPFLRLWMGEEYAALSYPTLVILALPLSLALAQSVPVRILYGTGRLRWFARAVIAEAALNLLLSIALVRPYGIEGVALGTALPNTLLNCAVGVYVCRTMAVPVGTYLRRSFLAPCATALLPGGVWLASWLWGEPDTWLSLVVTTASGLAAYLAVAVAAEVGWGNLLGRVAAALRPAGTVPVSEPQVISTSTKESACDTSLTPSRVRCEASSSA
jgi:O-antigen/teichoic acid export membrane protein